MLARSKLNSIESKISKALTDHEIIHEDFEIIINEEKNIENWKKVLEWTWLLEVNLIEEGKNLGINEITRHNEINNNSLNINTYKYKNEIILFKV